MRSLRRLRKAKIHDFDRGASSFIKSSVPSGIGALLMESLILAQDERLRRA